MRDVTPDSKNHIDLKALIKYLFEFVKHPAKNIATLPDWPWSSLVTLHLLMTIVSGVLAGLLKINFYRVAAGIFLMPFVSTAVVALLSMYLYFYFQFFENRTESFRKICTLVVLSAIPFYLFQVVSEYFALISVVGLCFASMLAVIGLNENFSVVKKRAFQIMGVMFGLMLVTWVANHFS